MRLINRHTSELIRELSESEKRSLVDFHTKTESQFVGAASELIQSARNDSQYFVCDCVSFQPSSPTLTTRYVNQGNYALVNLPGRKLHAFNCPFSYKPSEGLERLKTEPQAVEVLVYEEQERIKVNEEQLSTLYRLLVTNTQLNRLTSSTERNADSFRSKLIDGCRLSPSLAKQGIAKRLRFGIDKHQEVIQEIKQNEGVEWLILISLVDGTDGQNLFVGDIAAKPYKIPAGRIISLPCSTFGPMVATTVVAARGRHAFSLATAIDSVYTSEYPIVVSSQEDRVILDELIGSRSLFDWIDKKQPSAGNEPSFVDVHCLPTLAPITKSRTTPRMTLVKQGVRLLVADPTKMTREAYDEQGIVLWHRGFSHISSVLADELKQFKSKIAAILLNS